MQSMQWMVNVLEDLQRAAADRGLTSLAEQLQRAHTIALREATQEQTDAAGPGALADTSVEVARPAEGIPRPARKG